MAIPMQALAASLLLLLVLPDVDASWRSTAPQSVGVKAERILKAHRPAFQPGPWKQAHATFYEGDTKTFGGACAYDDVVAKGYGLDTTAMSTVLFNQGQKCGACYEIQCDSHLVPQWCKPPAFQSLFVTGTDHCPPNWSQPSDAGGWCNPPREHFDLAKPAYLKIAEYKAGIVPVNYRRVPCKKEGGVRFTITGNPWFYQVLVWNVAGAGDVKQVLVKGNKKVKWTEMKRNWGQIWITDQILQGESLTFRVRASDGRATTAWHIVPKDWQFGQTFEGKNFR